MKTTLSKRNTSLDLIRSLAFVFVVCTHFFKYAEYNSGPIQGLGMYGMTLLRTLPSTCVALFMVLSGYLMYDRKISRRYFGKLTRTLAVYVLASLACAVYRNLADNNPLSFQQTVRGILDFTAAPYSWYIEMYIGLFLLIPFLNVLYQNLESKQHKQLLLGILLFSTALPSVANIWCFLEPEWWRNPGISMAHYKLVPQWWENLYPITYYYIGSYLREYPLKMKPAGKLALVTAVTVISGTYSYWRSYGSYFSFGMWQDHGSLAVVVMTVLVFSLLSELPMQNASDGVRRWLARCSDWSLGAYLVSWIFDEMFYEVLNARVPVIRDRMVWYPVMVALVCVCSLALSAAVTVTADCLVKGLRPRKD